jgi:hypothetical protein
LHAPVTGRRPGARVPDNHNPNDTPRKSCTARAAACREDDAGPRTSSTAPRLQDYIRYVSLRPNCSQLCMPESVKLVDTPPELCDENLPKVMVANGPTA